MANSLCPTCTKSVWCPTWCEVRCKELKTTIYSYQKLTFCKFYTKRDKNFKEPRCHCKNCLENEKLLDIEEGD